MAKYVKKPIVIEAVQWIPEKTDNEVILLLQKTPIDYRFPDVGILEIETLEGWLRASPNDYVIRGIKGECYPCKPDIFESTYELVED